MSAEHPKVHKLEVGGVLGMSGVMSSLTVLPQHARRWYEDAVAEVSSTSDNRDSRRREIVFAVSGADSYLFEWVPDVTGAQQLLWTWELAAIGTGIRGSSTSFTVLGRSVRDTTTDGEKEDIMRPIIGIGALGAVVGVGIGLILGGIAAGVVVGILGLASGAYYGKTRGRSNPN